MAVKARSPTKAYVQYSKKITTTITVFWCFYRVLTLIAVIISPTMSTAVSQLLSGVDDVMMIAIGFYCGNSVAEKGILGYFKAKGASTEESTDDETCG